MSLFRFPPTTLGATAVLLAASSFVGLSHGHMIMSFPEPYGHLKTPYTSVNPLSASDSSNPFPCQGLSNAESVTTLTAGQSQLVKFTGGAQHGGGSCQFSISYDGPAAPKDKWKAIYTLIGGCPVSAAGNLAPGAPDPVGRADSAHCGNDAGTECIRQFDVPIPKGLKPGKAVFAWTWFNKIGNREMYMSCAPVEIRGGDADEAFLGALPAPFVANVPGECKTGQGVLNIPNPGRFGRVLEQPAAGSEGSCAKAAGLPTFESAATGSTGNATASTTGSAGSASMGAGGAEPSSASAPMPAAAATGFMTVATSAAVSSAAPSSMPLQVIPVHEDGTSTAAAAPAMTGSSSSSATPPAQPLPPASDAGAGSASSAGGGSSSSSSSSPASAGSGAPPSPGSAQSCSADGAIVCIGSGQWGLCDHGHAVPQALAPGTTCSNGAILRRRSWFY